MAHRSATPQAVVDTLTWIQSHYNFNISSLVSDLGGEMTGGVVKNYLRDRGILHFFSLDPKVKTAIVERVISFVRSRSRVDLSRIVSLSLFQISQGTYLQTVCGQRLVRPAHRPAARRGRSQRHVQPQPTTSYGAKGRRGRRQNRPSLRSLVWSAVVSRPTHAIQTGTRLVSRKKIQISLEITQNWLFFLPK